ncbi:MAG: hypothetical protein R3281_07155 [Balneolaceae bacterium]|nr:hypothetical protein [Balneolaceae bacterium]
MADDSPAENSSNKSSKKWVRILIIVAIGIPVLIELNTLVNLVKVHLLGEEPQAAGHTEQVESNRIREYVAGDTLFAHQDYALLLGEAQVDVRPGHWDFRMNLQAAPPATGYRADLDSIVLRSDRVIYPGDQAGWDRDNKGGTSTLQGTWQVENGDIPDRMYLSIYPTGDSGSDTTRVERLDIPFGPIPIRYRQE